MSLFVCVVFNVIFTYCDGRRHSGERMSAVEIHRGGSHNKFEQVKSNRSKSPFDGDPFVWLEQKIKGIVTTFRTAIDDDDAPMDEIKASARKIVDRLGGDVEEYSRAIKHCSWLQAVPESSAKPIKQPIPDDLNLGVTFKSRSKDGFIGRYEVAVASVEEGSIAQQLGVVSGMHPRVVRGKPTAFVSSNHVHHGDMTLKQFNEALKGHGPAVVIYDPPNYQQRRQAAVHSCMLAISSECGSDAVRPLEVTAVDINYLEDHCGGCNFFCADRAQTKYESNDVEDWSTLLEVGNTFIVRVPFEVKSIEIADGPPEGMELSGNIIQVDSAKSREHCLFTGMSLVEVNGQRLDVEQPLDHLDGAWRYLANGNEKEYLVKRQLTDELDEYEYFFFEIVDHKEKTGQLVEKEMENGRWWLADLPKGEQIRLRRDGTHMVSQHRTSSKTSWKRPHQATLASPRQRLEADRGKSLSLKVRPMGLQDVEAVVKSVRTTNSSYCREGQAEVQVYVDDDAWLNAFSRAGAVPISFPMLDTRSNFQCGAFMADSFSEVVDAAKDLAQDDLKWGTLQISISITAGVTAVVFPPIIGLHGAVAMGAGIGIKSVGTALKAGAHGAERVSHGGKFNGSAVALELGVGVGLNALSVVGGHEVGHLVGHHIAHGGEMVSGNAAETVIEELGEHAVEKLLHKGHSDSDNIGQSETISETCLELLFEPEGVWY